jgi:hypothetical protein
VASFVFPSVDMKYPNCMTHNKYAHVTMINYIMRNSTICTPHPILFGQ